MKSLRAAIATFAFALPVSAFPHSAGHRFYTPPHYHMERGDLGVQYTATRESYPDLEFTCGEHGAARCEPTSPRYARYMRLANWRIDRPVSAPGTCVLGQTYGYGSRHVWVSGECVAVFRAPDLRYGDEANRMRAARLAGR